MDAPRIPFPTAPAPLTKNGAVTGAPRLGYPDQARPCRGHPCLVHDGECVWCGRLPGDVIAATWAERERRVAAV